MNFQPINPDQHLKELKRIAKYHSVHLSMNISAILAIIGGAGVLIIASFFLPQGKSLFPTITACGIAILGGSLIRFKNSQLLLLASIILGFILIRNGFIIYNLYQQRNTSESILPLLIIIPYTFALLFMFLKNYYDNQKYCQFTPEPTLYAWLQGEIESLKNRQSLHDGNVIKFGINAGKTQISWRGRLYRQSILLVSGTTVKFVKQGDFVIHRDDSTLWKKIKQLFGTEFIIEGRKHGGSINHDSYERYLHWGEIPVQSNDNWHVPWA